ncbi:hypothetical protein [Variovorax gossypii]
MTEAAKATADPKGVHPLRLANLIVDLINAQGVPHEHRTKVLDGLIHAYLQTAQHVGLLEVAAQVMCNEGARILNVLRQQQARSAATDVAANTYAFVVDPSKLH